ncbi:MAG TPA: glycosyltransferase family 4 protein [Solirubrobacteraceae bacterium]|nr:glycosyltransferase family 4 protein [Solirubrobacteraceae bacterium]
MAGRPPPLVVQYLYVHAPGERFDYPSSRSHGGSGQLAARYLECVLVQAASLRLRGVDCDLALVSNLADRRVVGRRGARLLEEIESLGVEMLFADYLHRPPVETSTFASSRYVLDAILAVGANEDPDRRLWLVDVDCVWIDAPKVFAAAPPAPGIGCIHIPYPPDWELYGFTPRTLGELAVRLGAPGGALRWVGGELLAGAAADLRALVSTCEQLEREVAAEGQALRTEEQLLSLAGALGRAQFHDLFHVAQRIWTGPRHGAPPLGDVASLGLWHLPSEKGLGFRRAARTIASGHGERLARDLEVPARALRRFNVLGAGWTRRVRDDGWLAAQRLRDVVRSRLRRGSAQRAVETPGPGIAAGRVLMIEQGGRGGVADYTAQLTRALAAESWRIELATAEDHRYRPAPGVTVHGVFRYVRGRGRLARAVRRVGLGPLANGLRFLLAMPRLIGLAREADLAHTQGWEFAPLGLVATGCLRLAGIPMVQTAHNTFERGRSLDRTHAWLARLSPHTIVHTEADLARVPGTAGGRVSVIPHGEYGGLAREGGPADREAARARLGIAPETPVTLLFGQLRADKGLGDLLAALGRLPGLHLLIGGQEEGALAAAEEQLASPELAGRVTVREGFLDMREAAELFAATDTVALPYTVASQSGVLLLAYGFRRPVIVYPVGGLVEAVLDGETGWICARPDVEALAGALAAAIDAGWPECRRRGEAGARLAEERFAWPAIARRTGALYRELLAGRRVL